MLPKAARIPHAMTLHGDTRIDNYYWLRDDTRSQPEVLDYLQQENSYGHRVMASQQALQDRILKEIIDRIPQREVSAPYIKNGYRYRHIYEPGCEYAIYQRQSAFVFVIWKLVTGTRNCWITLNPALSGQMTPGLSTMFASIR